MTTLYKISGGALVPVQRSQLSTEEMLENWIVEDVSIIGLDALVLGRQISTDFGGKIDILALGREGDVTVIELKRHRTPRDVVAQTLDYASWVSILPTRRIHEIAVEKLGIRLEDAYRDKFDAPIPETLNGSHNMVIVASEFDASSSRIVEYLAEEHGIGINTVFFSVFEANGEQLLTTDWLMDQQEVIERSESKKKAPWTGKWYANVGDGPDRSWEDMRKYGFLSAGNGRFYSVRLEQLSVDDPVYAYQKQAGYVGYGTVASPSMMIKDFEVNGEPLLDQPLTQPNLSHDKDDPENAEYAVAIDWHKTFPIGDAKTFTGIFANQNVVCKLRDTATLDFLKNVFDSAQTA